MTSDPVPASGPHFAGPAQRRLLELGMLAAVARQAAGLHGPATGMRAVARLRERSAPFDDAFGPRKYVRVGRRWFPRWLLPSWPSPTFSRWAEVRLGEAVTGRMDPRYMSMVFLGVSSRCSLHCAHCSAADELVDHEVVPIERHVALVRTLQDRGMMQLHLTGGEPLGRFDDVVTLLKSMRPGTDTWLNTSGVGMTAERARALAQAGLVGVIVSLDHWEEARHDAFRGARHVFDRAAAACEASTAAGLAVALSACPTREALDPEWLDRMHRLGGELRASFLRFVEPRPSGRWQGQDVRLDDAQTALVERFERQANADPARRTLPVIVNYDRLSRTLGCAGGGDRELYVDSHGRGRACPFCGTPVGDVFEEGLDAVIAQLRERGCGPHPSARFFAR